MRSIKYLVVHCTASAPTSTVEKIQNYWKEHLGWKNPGYHILIGRLGEIHRIHPEEQVSNGVGGGYNTPSLNVSYIGGIDKDGKAIDNRTPEQKEAIIKVLKEWKLKHPNAEILGHRDFWFKYKYSGARKACPCFDAIKEYSEIK
jgi:N-acetylmuramoyl-L-alanine amidase